MRTPDRRLLALAALLIVTPAARPQSPPDRAGSRVDQAVEAYRKGLGLELEAPTLALELPRPAMFQPAEGFVPDARTAIRIARAIWAPIHGATKRSVRARLVDGVWHVEGAPRGLPAAQIRKDTGQVLGVSHGK